VLPAIIAIGGLYSTKPDKPKLVHTLSVLIIIGVIVGIVLELKDSHSKNQQQNKAEAAYKQIENLNNQNNELITQNKELSGKIEKYQQIIISRLDELLESTDNENETKLLEKYPAGYVLFGVDLLSTFSRNTFPHGRALFEEYEFDWSEVTIEQLTSESLEIRMPNIRYKPLNTWLKGTTRGIPRRPLGKEYIYPVSLAGMRHRIFVELSKDNNQQLIFVIGFRKTE